MEDEAVVARAAVAGLAAAVDDLLSVAWWQSPSSEVAAAVVELERQASRLEAARLRLLAEADQRAIASAAGAVSTASWFAHATTTGRERAGSRAALAAALEAGAAGAPAARGGAAAGPALPATSPALAAGDLTLDHAQVIHVAMTGLAELARRDAAIDAEVLARAEAFLVEQAALLDPRQLARVAASLRHRLDEGAGEAMARDEDVQVRERSVSLRQGDDGRWHLRGVPDAVGGARVAAALDQLSAPRAAGAGGGGGGRRDAHPALARRGDALVQLADSWLAGQRGTATSRARLVVVVPWSTVRHPGARGAAPGLLAGSASGAGGGAAVSAVAVAVLACDGEVVPVLVDDAGAPLDVGRTVYVFPDTIRAAVLARDGGCTFTGCDRPTTWCEIHHLQPYAAGGATSERNGTALCGHHHRLVHRRSWHGELVGAQVVWRPPERGGAGQGEGGAPGSTATGERPPPPAWTAALDRLVDRWRERWGGDAASRAA